MGLSQIYEEAYGSLEELGEMITDMEGKLYYDGNRKRYLHYTEERTASRIQLLKEVRNRWEKEASE